MQIYHGYYFNNARKLAYLAGLWPWQRSKYIFRGLYAATIILFNIPLVGSAMRTKDPIILMENMYGLLLSLAVFMKVFALAFAEKKMIVLYKGIAENWKNIVDVNERKLLTKHSEIGRKASIICTTFYTFAFATFTLLPWIPIILNIVNPSPKPRPYIYLLRADYGLDDQDTYYYYIYISDFAKCTCVLTAALSVDPMYATCVEHFVALYSIVTYRLRLLKHMSPDASSKTKDAALDWLIDTIKVHQKTLSFTSILESSYSICFLAVILVNLFSIPLTCVLLLASFKEGHLINMFRYAVLFSCLAIHLFTSFMPGQRLQQYSSELFHDAYLNKWYETSEKTKKLLKITMLRATAASTLTAGRLITMNLENYYLIMKVAVSYITVFASFQ